MGGATRSETLLRLERPAAVGAVALGAALALLQTRPAVRLSTHVSSRPGRPLRTSDLRRPHVWLPAVRSGGVRAVCGTASGAGEPVYALLQVALAVCGSALLGVRLFPQHRLLAAAVATVGLLSSGFYCSSVQLYNVSLVMVLPLVAVCWL